MLAIGAAALATAFVRGETDALRRRLEEVTKSSCVSPDYVLRLEAENFDEESGSWMDSSGRGNHAHDHEVDVEGSYTTEGFNTWSCCEFEGRVSHFVDGGGEIVGSGMETVSERECEEQCTEDSFCVAYELVSTEVDVWHSDCDKYQWNNKRYACKLHFQESGATSPFLAVQKCSKLPNHFYSCDIKSKHFKQDLGNLHWDSPRKAVADNGEPVVRFRTQLEDLQISKLRSGIEAGDARSLCFKMDTSSEESMNEIFGTRSHRSIDLGTYYPTADKRYRPSRLRLRNYETCEDDKNYYSPKDSVPNGIHTFCIMGDGERTEVWMDGEMFADLKESFFGYSLNDVATAVGSARYSRKYGHSRDRGFVGDIYEMILYPRFLLHWEIENIHAHFTRFDDM